MFTDKTYSLDLEFLSPYPLGKEDLPGHAIARVSVKRYRQNQNGIDIGLECASPRELEDQIDRLHEELEEIRKVGKRKFAAHDQREEEWRNSLSRHQVKSPLSRSELN